jgi:hypothetical protein
MTSPAPKPSAPRRPWVPIAAIAGAVVLLIAVAAGVYFWAKMGPSAPTPSRHAMAVTALTGIEAVISGDINTLSSISDATMKAQITGDVATKLQMSGLVATFSDPKWNGDNFEVLITTSKGQGVLLGGPVPDGKDVVLYRTMGMIAATTGGVSLTPSGSGWLVTQFVAGNSAPATGSVSATGSASTTASAVTTP